jgi:hypothetical protein
MNVRTNLGPESELLYDWQFTAKPVRLGAETLEDNGQYFFLQLSPYGHTPSYNILSDERMCLSLINRLGLRQSSPVQ